MAQRQIAADDDVEVAEVANDRAIEAGDPRGEVLLVARGGAFGPPKRQAASAGEDRGAQRSNARR
jgi:hypothetical protein